MLSPPFSFASSKNQCGPGNDLANLLTGRPRLTFCRISSPVSAVICQLVECLPISHLKRSNKPSNYAILQTVPRGTPLVNQLGDNFALCAALYRDDKGRWREKP